MVLHSPCRSLLLTVAPGSLEGWKVCRKLGLSTEIVELLVA